MTPAFSKNSAVVFALGAAILLFLFIGISSSLGWWALRGEGPYAHTLATIENKLELLEKTPSPKIIVLGGSGTYVGVRCEEISQACARPAVNLGFYAGYGLHDWLDLITPGLAKGDLVILIPEYDNWLCDFRSDEHARPWVFLARARREPVCQAIKKNYGRPSLDLLADLSVLFQYKLAARVNAIWSKQRSSAGFIHFNSERNPYGDAPAYVFAPAAEIATTEPSLEKLQKFDWRALAEAIERMQAKGATVRLSFPAFPERDGKANARFLAGVVQGGKTRLPAGVLLGAPEDFLYPLSYFTNTCYHLNDAARELRTEKLIDLLKSPGP